MDLWARAEIGHAHEVFNLGWRSYESVHDGAEHKTQVVLDIIDTTENRPRRSMHIQRCMLEGEAIITPAFRPKGIRDRASTAVQWYNAYLEEIGHNRL